MNMGHAAYNRGTQVIRRQIDQQIDAARPDIEARHERETARETIEALRQELETARAEHIVTAEQLAAALDEEKTLRTRAEELAAHYKDRMKTVQKALSETTHNRNKLSAIARTFRTMHPEQYADIRQHAEELYPHTFKPCTD